MMSQPIGIRHPTGLPNSGQNLPGVQPLKYPMTHGRAVVCEPPASATSACTRETHSHGVLTEKASGLYRLRIPSCSPTRSSRRAISADSQAQEWASLLGMQNPKPKSNSDSTRTLSCQDPCPLLNERQERIYSGPNFSPDYQRRVREWVEQQRSNQDSPSSSHQELRLGLPLTSGRSIQSFSEHTHRQPASRVMTDPLEAGPVEMMKGKEHLLSTSTTSLSSCSSSKSSQETSTETIFLRKSKVSWYPLTIAAMSAGTFALLQGTLAWSWLRFWGPLITKQPLIANSGILSSLKQACPSLRSISLLRTCGVEFVPVDVSTAYLKWAVWHSLLPIKAQSLNNLNLINAWFKLPYPTWPSHLTWFQKITGWWWGASTARGLCLQESILRWRKLLGILTLVAIGYWLWPKQTGDTLTVPSAVWEKTLSEAKTAMCLTSRSSYEVKNLLHKLVQSQPDLQPEMARKVAIAALQEAVKLQPEEAALMEEMAENTKYAAFQSRQAKGRWSFLPCSAKLIFPSA
ncbi:non-structural protein [Erinaceus virus H14]|nr:non-structural protein [Erinaceus virus H14]